MTEPRFPCPIDRGGEIIQYEEPYIVQKWFQCVLPCGGRKVGHGTVLHVRRDDGEIPNGFLRCVGSPSQGN